MEIIFNAWKKLQALKGIYFSFDAGTIYQSGSFFLKKWHQKYFGRGDSILVTGGWKRAYSEMS